ASGARASRPAAATSALSQQQPAATTVRYTVRKGDTLSGIARRHNTTVRALVAANGMPDANATLRINQVLTIPQPGTTQAPRKKTQATAKPAPAPKPAASTPAASTPGIHTIKPGDTIYRISRQYGVTPADLMKANGLTPETANTIRVGATLRIPAAH
ncbi:MAG: LysM peptidoglycan-binding domain-containing protein, partial [Akkermansia sp.]|nr:LysM peptidoglycan-binding domain-containing protein [Akkermansia sp.]